MSNKKGFTLIELLIVVVIIGILAAITRSIVVRHACSGDIPWRISSTMRNDPHVLIAASPRPMDPAAPTLLSQYWPAPMIGESPTLPAIFHERPLVVVTDEMSPAAFTAVMWMVPWVN